MSVLIIIMNDKKYRSINNFYETFQKVYINILSDEHSRLS